MTADEEKIRHDLSETMKKKMDEDNQKLLETKVQRERARARERERAREIESERERERERERARERERRGGLVGW